MYILAIETCTNRTSVALSKDNHIIDTDISKCESTQAETLVPMISHLLISNNLSYHDIQYIALTVGPGSFVGTRVGITFAKAAQICQNITIISLSTLEVIAAKMISISNAFDHYISIQGSYRNELYIQNFNNVLKAQSNIEIINISNIEDYYRMWNGIIASVGSGLQSINLDKLFKDKRLYFFPRFQYPDARTIAQIAYTKIIKGDTNTLLNPLYIRKPNATISTTNKIISN